MTRNIADFQGLNISHEDGGRNSTILVNATHPDHGTVGYLSLGYSIGGQRKIRDIWVKPDFRRRGVATALYNYAVNNGLNPKHSAERTNAGEAWARTVSKRLPRRFYGDL